MGCRSMLSTRYKRRSNTMPIIPPPSIIAFVLFCMFESSQSRLVDMVIIGLVVVHVIGCGLCICSDSFTVQIILIG